MTSKLVSREQGDINSLTNRETFWNRKLGENARVLFEEDQKYFLHQSLCTPVLNALSKCDGANLYDMVDFILTTLEEAIRRDENGEVYK